MTLNIISEKESPVFKRKEVHLRINSSISPNRKDVLGLVSKNYSVKPEQVKILNITGKFGSHEFNVFVNVYESEEQRTNVELSRKRDNIFLEEPKTEEPAKEEVVKENVTSSDEKPSEEKQEPEVKEEIKEEV